MKVLHEHIDSIKACAIEVLPAYRDVCIVAIPVEVLGFEVYGIFWARPAEGGTDVTPVASLMEKGMCMPRMRRELVKYLQSVKNIKELT